MASKLPHPSSGNDLPKFRDRVRKSPPTAPITTKWLMDNLGFTQASNAGTLLSMLEGIGFLDDQGALTPRGECLMAGSESPGYQQAMAEAIDQLLTKERADSIRAGSISKEQLPGYLAQQFKVGEGMVKKFFTGLRWLATEGKDEAILQACPSERVRAGTGSRARGQKDTRRRSGAVASGSTSATAKPSPPIPQESADKGEIATVSDGNDQHSAPNNRLLDSGTIRISIDSGWKIEDIRQTLRMMQMIERGEAIPPSEESSDDSTATSV
jgi:hypothetical protein